MADSTARVKHLVIDTNAIINGVSLKDAAEHFYTCPEVLAEVRSAHSKDYLTRLPFEIQLDQPSEEAVKAVIQFAKQTGDYASLSMPDIKVIALTYSLEAKHNGIDHIRTEPVKNRPNGTLGSAPPPYQPKTITTVAVDDDGWEIAGSARKETLKKKNKKNYNKKKAQNAVQVAVTPKDEPKEEAIEQAQEVKKEEPIEAPKEEVQKQPKEEVAIEQAVSSSSGGSNDQSVDQLAQGVQDVVIETEPPLDDEEDDGEWITPENLDEFRAAALGVTPADYQRLNTMDVACMTNDFAMQNVLLQMNMNLVSTGGHRITKIKNWVLRCHGCFSVTSDMERKFCPKCGGATLTRVSCSTNSNGTVRYHLKHGHSYNLRGTVFSMPNPKGGRVHNNIVLREDQREYVKAKETQSKKKLVDMFDPDFIPIYGSKTGERDLNNNMFGTDVIGSGRRNPNQSRKRTGKKKQPSLF
ncbi:Nin one binding Zn-ribbon like-domain-containing protein [Gongronella butleri]|nr:Nin one binding Zn-ribbon like-domain-containing protein [Gongronella butleri]